jgi:hypothetical protein
VYGPVCTVVWQGSVGDCRPYADLVAKCSGMAPGDSCISCPLSGSRRLVTTIAE